ncbi:hypothetical protein MTR67_001320 [Solanum verrucosum]|uniref:Uncharacterized protein n=1 Tax=Solanum verrucosum TaxID=315347 RepID=A0AAF0PRN2_SOLVR|nr:hypothetical protein MTR67_001320 [Solanum verrucosum]
MELLKDYDVTIQYHSGKANVVADTLSRKEISMGNLAYLGVSKRPLVGEIQTLASGFVGRACLPRVDNLMQNLLAESYGSRYLIHPGITKIYRDLRQLLWFGLKKGHR